MCRPCSRRARCEQPTCGSPWQTRSGSGLPRRRAMPAPDKTAPLALVVEDNPDNLLLSCAVLRRAGYRTEEARSAEEAALRLAVRRPDLILMDIQLPGQDGLALTRQLR